METKREQFLVQNYRAIQAIRDTQTASQWLRDEGLDLREVGRIYRLACDKKYTT